MESLKFSRLTDATIALNVTRTKSMLIQQELSTTRICVNINSLQKQLSAIS